MQLDLLRGKHLQPAAVYGQKAVAMFIGAQEMLELEQHLQQQHLKFHLHLHHQLLLALQQTMTQLAQASNLNGTILIFSQATTFLTKHLGFIPYGQV